MQVSRERALTLSFFCNIFNSSGTKQVTLSRTAKIDDTVSYKGAIRGTSYKINGTLMNKSTGEAAVDGDGKLITASGVFTAGSATGTATVTFNTNGMAGGAYVAFEEQPEEKKHFGELIWI